MLGPIRDFFAQLRDLYNPDLKHKLHVQRIFKEPLSILNPQNDFINKKNGRARQMAFLRYQP